jgi:hypothetical protein
MLVITKSFFTMAYGEPWGDVQSYRTRDSVEAYLNRQIGSEAMRHMRVSQAT